MSRRRVMSSIDPPAERPEVNRRKRGRKKQNAKKEKRIYSSQESASGGKGTMRKLGSFYWSRASLSRTSPEEE